MSSTQISTLDELLESPVGQEFQEVLRSTPPELYIEANNKRNGHLLKRFVVDHPQEAEEIMEAYEKEFGKPLFELARAILDYKRAQRKVEKNEEIIQKNEKQENRVELDDYLDEHPETVDQLKKLINTLGKNRSIDALHELEQELAEKIKKIG